MATCWRGRTCPYHKQVRGCWFRHGDEVDLEEVPLCRDVAASACSFGLVHAPFKELSSRIQGLLNQIVDDPMWEEIAEAIQLVPQEQVFQSIGEQIVDGTERVVEQIVAVPCFQHRTEEQIVSDLVPQIAVDGVDVVQFIPQECVDRTQKLFVGVPVPQIMKEIVEVLPCPVPQVMEEILKVTQPVLHKRIQERVGRAFKWHGHRPLWICGWQLRLWKVRSQSHDPGLHKNTWLGPCGPVTGQNSLDAELGGCGMLMENLRPWIDKCVRQERTLFIAVDMSSLHKYIFRWNALHAGGPLPSPILPLGRWVACGSGV